VELQITATKEIDYKANRSWVQQHTLFVNPIHTNTTPGHCTFTYYYILGTYRVFVCIRLLIIEQNNGMIGKTEAKQKCGNVIHCYYKKKNFVVFQTYK